MTLAASFNGCETDRGRWLIFLLLTKRELLNLEEGIFR
jgi:hypothetical protein